MKSVKEESKGWIKFWEWMVKKGYGAIDSDLYKTVRLITHNVPYKDRRCVDPTLQMLIGYKIEYIAERLTNKKDDFTLVMIGHFCHNINKLDNYLDLIIEELE